MSWSALQANLRMNDMLIYANCTGTLAINVKEGPVMELGILNITIIICFLHYSTERIKSM